MRMCMRRFTRLTNRFSKKVENLMHAVALHFMYYNFVRIHQTLRVRPAMEAGVSNHPWTIEEIVFFGRLGCNQTRERQHINGSSFYVEWWRLRRINNRTVTPAGVPSLPPIKLTHYQSLASLDNQHDETRYSSRHQ
jgi:hypothetical protein